MKRIYLAATITIIFMGCGGRTIGGNNNTRPDAQVDGGTTERIIEYTVAYSSTADINIGDTDVSLIRIRFENLSNEDATVDTVGFQMLYFPWMNIANPTLSQGGTPVNATTIQENDSLYMEFDLLSDYSLPAGGQVEFELRGDVFDGICMEVGTEFNSENSRIRGLNEVPFELVPSAQSQEMVERPTYSHLYWLMNRRDQVPEAFVPAGSNNVPLIEFWFLRNRPFRIDYLEARIFFTLDTIDHVESVRLAKQNSQGDWEVIALGFLNPDRCVYETCHVEFDDTIALEGGCVGNIYRILVDIAQSAPAGNDMTIEVITTLLEAYDENNQPIPAPEYSMTGSQQHIM